MMVTPYAGVWIEIRYLTIIGLPINVTPYAGVRIEIQTTQMNRQSAWVTPYAGVWIEIKNYKDFQKWKLSLPTRECGLKSVGKVTGLSVFGHSLRGSVD